MFAHIALSFIGPGLVASALVVINAGHCFISLLTHFL